MEINKYKFDIKSVYLDSSNDLYLHRNDHTQNSHSYHQNIMIKIGYQ